jgi:predicted esterase
MLGACSTTTCHAMTARSTCSALLRRGLMLLLSLTCLTLGNAARAEDRFIPRDMRACTAEHAAAGFDLPCKQALPADAVAFELGKLKTKDFAYEVKGDTLVVSVRMKPDEVPFPNGPYLCCEIQAYLDKVAENVYAARFRWNRMTTALLDLNLQDVNKRPDARIAYNGSPEFVFTGAKLDKGLIARAGAELTTVSLDAGAELGVRKVTVFRGADCRQGVAGCAVIYMPDGESTRAFVDNALATGIDMRRLVVAGVHHAEVDPMNTRIEELLLGYNEARYDAFMRFVIGDLKARIEGADRPARRIAAGFSNGGSWAYAALVSQSSHFDGAIVMSPGEFKTRNDLPLPGKLAVVGAGYMERGFYRSATTVAAGLKARGATVKEVYVPSGHGFNTWVNVWNTAMTELDSRAN